MKLCVGCILRNIGLAVIILGTIFLLGLLQGVLEKGREPHVPSPPVSERVYREPSVVIPYVTRDKQPIPNERLPIPKRDVDKSIEITTPAGKVDIVIDKGGQVYPAKDTPADVTIAVTKWKPRLVALESRFGYSGVYDGRALYHCLSFDCVRFGRVHLGSEIGASADLHKVLIGLSGKVRVIDRGVGVSVVAGWNFIGGRAYAGVNVSW